MLRYFDQVICFLLIVGGINWGLVGFFDFNLVTFISFGQTMIEQLVYGLVGLAALYKAYAWITGAKCSMGE